MRLILSAETVQPQKHDSNYADTTRGVRNNERVLIYLCTLTARFLQHPETPYVQKSHLLFSTDPLSQVVKFASRSFYVILISQLVAYLNKKKVEWNVVCSSDWLANKEICHPGKTDGGLSQ